MASPDKKRDKIRELLDNDLFIQWRLSRDEELGLYWDNFIKENPEYKDALREACRKFEAVRMNDRHITDEKKKILYDNIMGRLQRRKRRARVWTYSAAGVAAALLFVFIFGNDIFRPASGDGPIAGKLAADDLGGGNILLITDNEIIELDQETAQFKIDPSGSITVLDSLDTVVQSTRKRTGVSKMVVPAGRRSSMTLADGSQIWLNSCTELTVPNQFAEDVREISVKGEIYADVAADNDRPFIVHTPGFDVIVHGTQFNISTYEDDAEKFVVLVEGSVSLRTEHHGLVELRPNELAIVGSGGIEKKTVDVSEYTGWKDGVLVFKGANLSQVLTKIGRYYNVAFETAGDIDLTKKSFSGKLFLSNALDSIMVSVSAISSTRYDKIDDTIYLKPQLPME